MTRGTNTIRAGSPSSPTSRGRVQRAGRHRAAGADQPRAPRRDRRRTRHRRRRRHPAPGPGPLLPRGRRLRAPAGRAPTPSASRSCPPTTSCEKAMAAIDATGRRGRARRARMARPAGRTRLPRQDVAGGDADVQAAVRRRPGRRDRHRPRPQGLRRPQAQPPRARPATSTRYFASLSSRTIVYKGMLTTPQLSEFFPDLTDPRVESALLLVHSRFSTNTFPSWPLAHPYRFVAHNGEINTVQGNQNWMRAREAMLESRSCRASSGRSRSARPGPRTPLASTRCSNCCTSAATRSTTPC